MMAIIAGIDPSLTSTGIAVLQDGNPVTITHVGHGTRNGASYAHRSDRIVSQVRAVIDTVWKSSPGYPRTNITKDAPPLIDLALIEGPAYGANLPSAHDRAGLFWGLYSSLRAKRIPVIVIPPAKLKIWATGIGNATKPLVLEATRQSWPYTRITNHDEADALALASIGAAHAGDPLPFELRDRHRNTLNGIDWPEVVTHA
jgi:Holliday junction resolvasome RuvABC endonuclease subunit